MCLGFDLNNYTIPETNPQSIKARIDKPTSHQKVNGYAS